MKIGILLKLSNFAVSNRYRAESIPSIRGTQNTLHKLAMESARRAIYRDFAKIYNNPVEDLQPYVQEMNFFSTKVINRRTFISCQSNNSASNHLKNVIECKSDYTLVKVSDFFSERSTYISTRNQFDYYAPQYSIEEHKFIQVKVEILEPTESYGPTISNEANFSHFVLILCFNRNLYTSNCLVQLLLFENPHMISWVIEWLSRKVKKRNPPKSETFLVRSVKKIEKLKKVGMEYIGKNIQRIRMDKNLKQKDLAKKIGMSSSVTYISDIECGRRLPTLRKLEKIAEALGVSVQTIMSEREDLLILEQLLKKNKIDDLLGLLREVKKIVE